MKCFLFLQNVQPQRAHDKRGRCMLCMFHLQQQVITELAVKQINLFSYYIETYAMR